MDDIFTNKELNIAIDIVTSGLNEAAKSLAYFIKSETKLDLDDAFSVSEDFSDKHLTKQKGKIYLLTTELMGDLKGVSYLMFSEEEVTAIMKARYPNKDFDQDKYNKKSEALMLEIDNIITAGVMSKFANAFHYRTYGGVPKLDIVNYDKATEIIKNETHNSDYIMGFNARLVSEDTNIMADFVWSVDDAFIYGVKNYKE